MSDKDHTRQFVTKLKRAAKLMSHQELAKALGIPRWKCRNWLFRDSPNEWAVTILGPKLDKLLKKTKTDYAIGTGTI